MKKILTILFLFEFLFSKAQQPVLNLQVFSTGYTSPVDIVNCGDSRLFIVDQNGYIYICDSNGVKSSTAFLDIHTEIAYSSEQGLLGMAFDPNYATNRYFYLNYTDNSGGDTRISRFTTDAFNPDHADAATEIILKEINQPYSNHNGGCLRFGPDGYLYIGMGDGGNEGDPQGYGQNTLVDLSKMLRIDVSTVPYTVPSTNPFVGNSNYLPEIWDVGLRNPWRFSFDRITHDLWIGDVGQNNWEEVDFEPAGDPGGHNYGWRCYEGNHAYNTNGCSGSSNYDFPVAEYAHTFMGAAIIGGVVYRGPDYANLWGKYIFTDNYTGVFRYTVPDGNGGWTTTTWSDESNYIYGGFGEDRYGRVYVAGVGNGSIYTLGDTANCKPVSAIIQGDSVVSCNGQPATLNTVTGPGRTYQWYQDGNLLSGSTDNNYSAVQSGNYSVTVTNGIGCSTTSVTNLFIDPAVQPDIVLGSNNDSIICAGEGVYALIANPTGGVFSGPGVTADGINPNDVYLGFDTTITITYTYTDAYGCSGTDEQEFTITDCLGLNEIDKHLSIFPNPNMGIFEVRLRELLSNQAGIYLFDMGGKELLHQSAKLNNSYENKLLIDASMIESGIYLLKLSSGNQTYWKKIVIQK